jgi:hypothetical protein
MKKQAAEKPDKVRCTVWMRREVWKLTRLAALDRGVSFAHIMEQAAIAWLAENTPELLAKPMFRRPS